MERYLNVALADELGKKILLLTGPRQCGKTTLSLLTRSPAICKKAQIRSDTGCNYWKTFM